MANLKYYTLIPKDPRNLSYVFFQDDEDDVLQVRPSYKHLQCSCCGKFDEDAALRLPIEADVRVRATRDFVGTADGLICLSNRAQQVVTDSGIAGLEFIALPGGSRYAIAVPTCLVKTDLATAGFEFQGPCPCCGRYYGVYVGPMVASLEKPDDPMVLFTSEIWNERRWVRQTFLVASDAVVKILRANKISGVHYSTNYS